MKKLLTILILSVLWACSIDNQKSLDFGNVYLTVLGIAQDAGYPQAGCNKSCCSNVWEGNVGPEKVVSLGLVDKTTDKVYLFDATPDFKEQLQSLLSHVSGTTINPLEGIFLTHAHIGHYTGLIHLGREAIGASNVPVYAMPRMDSFLRNNGPWSQLVSLQNIHIIQQKPDSTIILSENIQVTPFIVPHRQEFSETVGYKITVNNKTVMFIPDIDKWSKWKKDIVKEVEKVDYAFIDASFYDGDELPNRDMSEIPHPFVIETIDLFKNSPESTKNKINLIHFNHTNPLLNNGEAYLHVTNLGFKVAREGDIVILK